MEYEVRHAEEADGEQLLELWHGFTAHLSEYDERYAHKKDADDRWLSYFEGRLVDSKYGTVIVAEDPDGELIGVLEARVTGDHPLFRLDDHGYVNGLFVREPYRGERVGEDLLEAAEEWLTEPPRNVDFYRIDVLDGDDAAASALDSYGFEPAEHVYEKRF